MVISSVSMRVKRSPKIVSIRLKWQISSFIDHLPGTLRVASAASSNPAASRFTSAACARRRWTSARCTACLSPMIVMMRAGSCRAL